MSWCLDCGTKMSGGICPNCHEELYILTYQSEDVAVSEMPREFVEKAEKQAAEIRKREGEKW